MIIGGSRVVVIVFHLVVFVCGDSRNEKCKRILLRKIIYTTTFYLVLCIAVLFSSVQIIYH